MKKTTGNDRRCKRSIDTMLSYEKYIGDVVVLKTYSSGFPNNHRVKNPDKEDSHPMYLAERSHEAIIKRTFLMLFRKKKSAGAILYRM